MKNIPNNPTFACDYLYYPFSSGGVMGEDGKKWVRSARTWLKAFCKEIGAINFELHTGHYYFYGFFMYKNQYWYFSSGDCRFKLFSGMLIRTAKNNKDYTGGCNQSVDYRSKNFKYELTCIINKELFYILP